MTLATAFGHNADSDFPYMFHGHLLEHEDSGTMGQFVIAPPGQTAGTPGPPTPHGRVWVVEPVTREQPGADAAVPGGAELGLLPDPVRQREVSHGDRSQTDTGAKPAAHRTTRTRPTQARVTRQALSQVARESIGLRHLRR
jgi:Multicopper oxidase